MDEVEIERPKKEQSTIGGGEEQIGVLVRGPVGQARQGQAGPGAL